MIIKNVASIIPKNKNTSLILVFFDIRARKKNGHVINILVLVARASPRNNADNFVLIFKKKVKTGKQESNRNGIKLPMYIANIYNYRGKPIKPY